MLAETKTNRRELLKTGAAALAAGGVLAVQSSTLNATPAGGTGAHLHGTVANGVLGSRDISINVDGPHADLSGAGWSFEPDAAVGTVLSAGLYTQAGSVHGHTLTLSGRMLFSADAMFPPDTTVTTSADFVSGAITCTLDPPGAVEPDVFAGTGTVIHL